MQNAWHVSNIGKPRVAARGEKGNAIFTLCDMITWRPGHLLFFFYFIEFIYFWLRWVFIAVRGLSLVAVNGGYSLLRSTGSGHAGFSSCGHGLSSCGTRA